MKKTISFILCLTMILGFTAVPAFAWATHTKAISSVKINVNLSDLSVGDEISDNAEAYVSVPDNEYYYLDDAEWIDEVRYLSVGDQPRMRVYLQASPKETSGSRYDTIWLFHTSYNSNNVRINKGEFISADRRDSGYTLEVTLRINPVNGHYEEPSDVYWTDQQGMGAWTVDENDSGYYDVICYRGSSAVKKLYAYHGTRYNFYPYMTREGDYTFKVRTVPAPNGKGKNSEWVESGGVYIDKNHVSDGTGQTTADEHNGGTGASGGSASGLPVYDNNAFPNGTGTANVAGWTNEGGYMYFRYPNGQYARDGWVKLDEKWYMFDSAGRMLTGWQQNKYGVWFYMDKSTGAMKTGWLQDNGNWYFLNTMEGDLQGSMVRGWYTWRDNRYYFNESGVMVTGWYEIGGRFYYFYPQSGTGTYGHLATNTKIGAFTIGADGAWVQ